MNIQKLFIALCAKSLVIDYVSDDRTYQISGDHRFQGMYERIFHSDSHPTRRNIGNSEAQTAIDNTTEIRIWTGPSQFRVISEAELETELSPFPVR